MARTQQRNRIRAWRVALGMTQQEVALRLQRHPTAISHWESDRRMPSANDLAQLADLFGVGVDQLVA